MTTTINSQIACLVEDNLNLKNPQKYKFRNAFLNPTDNVLLENIANTLNTRTPERYPTKTPKQYTDEVEKMRLDIIRKESEEGGAAQTDEMGDITKDQDKVKSDATKAKNLKDAKFKERVARRKERLKEEKKVVVPVKDAEDAKEEERLRVRRERREKKKADKQKEPEEEKEEEKGQSVPLKSKFSKQSDYHAKKIVDSTGFDDFNPKKALQTQAHPHLQPIMSKKKGAEDTRKILDKETPEIKRDNEDVKNLEDVNALLLTLNGDIDTAKEGHIKKLQDIKDSNKDKSVIYKDSYKSAEVYHEKIAELMSNAKKDLEETQKGGKSGASGGGGGGGGGLRKKGGKSKN